MFLEQILHRNPQGYSSFIHTGIATGHPLSKKYLQFWVVLSLYSPLWKHIFGKQLNLSTLCIYFKVSNWHKWITSKAKLTTFHCIKIAIRFHGVFVTKLKWICRKCYITILNHNSWKEFGIFSPLSKLIVVIFPTQFHYIYFDPGLWLYFWVLQLTQANVTIY